MRVDIEKILFVGTKGPLDQFLEEMQQIGKVQFATKPKAVGDLLGTGGYEIIKALKILGHYDAHTQLSRTPADDRSFIIRNPYLFAQEIISLRDEAERIQTELKAFSPHLLSYQKIGDIPWSDIDFIEQNSSLDFRFFEGSTDKNLQSHLSQLITLGSMEGGREYFISLEPITEALPAGLRELNRQEMKELRERLQKRRQRLTAIEHELSHKSRYIAALKAALFKEVNTARKEEAKGHSTFEVDNTLFILTGWCPKNHLDEIQKRTSAKGIIAEAILPEKDEAIPTYLENQGWGRVGEDLVHIYDTPSPSDLDPSWWVLGFFSLFFAIIVGDAGYGFVFLGIALYFQRKDIASALGRRVIKLVMLLGTSCIIWGLLFNSIFGISFSEKNPLKEYALITQLVKVKGDYHFSQGSDDSQVKGWIESHNNASPKDLDEFLYTPSAVTETVLADKFSDNILFELAIFIGAIHILTGMIRYLDRNLANLGWIAFFIGAYLYLPTYLETTSLIHFLLGIPPETGAQIGKELMVYGAGAAMLYSLFKHGITGIFECMMAVQLFADALSYLRLYALGLAGALVAKIINEATSTMPFILGIVVLIASHTINILLATVGGIIHGLRLNFLEWYHYSFEGGGKKFEPLRLEERD